MYFNYFPFPSLVKLPEVRETMHAMAKEMMRAGMIEELVDETMSSMEVTKLLNNILYSSDCSYFTPSVSSNVSTLYL